MPIPRRTRWLVASGGLLGALLTAGTLTARVRTGGSAASAEPPVQTPPAQQAKEDRPITWASPDLAPPLSACARGPVVVTDLTQTKDGFQRWQSPSVPEFHEFYFTRAIYTDHGRGFGG